MVDMEERISELENWESGWGLILRGAGGTFCSGGNIQFMKSLAERKTEGHPAIMSEHMQMTLDRLHKLPLLSVALLEGATLGGGSELAISCDFRIMSNSATFGFLQGRMGLSPGWGGGVKLTNLVGYGTALKLLASCAVLECKDALAIGLVDSTFSSDQNSMEMAYNFLKAFSKLPPEVLRANKSVVTRSMGFKATSEIYEEERNIFQSLFGGPAHLEALKKANVK